MAFEATLGSASCVPHQDNILPKYTANFFPESRGPFQTKRGEINRITVDFTCIKDLKRHNGNMKTGEWN